MLDKERLARVAKTSGQTAGQSQGAVELAQQEHTAIAAEVSAGEIGDDLARIEIIEKEGLTTKFDRRGLTAHDELGYSLAYERPEQSAIPHQISPQSAGHPFRKQQQPRLYVYFPLPLAAAIGLNAGDQVTWELLDRGELHLVRDKVSAPRARKRVNQSPKPQPTP